MKWVAAAGGGLGAEEEGEGDEEEDVGCQALPSEGGDTSFRDAEGYYTVDREGGVDVRFVEDSGNGLGLPWTLCYRFQVRYGTVRWVWWLGTTGG